MARNDFATRVERWYDEAARDLPWRRADVSPWGVLVSEVMLQQTPAARVVPAWEQWISRWPTPASLATDSPGEAVRAWGRLGYPRRALRLHETAVAITQHHDGDVPASYDALHSLPGIGGYTAAAVATFAFGGRHAVLDTNVRRVYSRVFNERADVTTTAPTVAERSAALALVPERDPARYGVAVMELGALVCMARGPRCLECPIADLCRWYLAGRPDGGPARRPQTYAGTDRQVRGRLLAVLRDASDTVDRAALDAVWDDEVQRDRALAALLTDGLVQLAGDGRYRLPV
jgi:A/G-specific adenine glycosylase